MTSRDQTIAGAIALFIIVAVYLVGLTKALGGKQPQNPEPLPTVTLIERGLVPLLSTLELNGQLPVAVAPEELGKTNPFGQE